MIVRHTVKRYRMFSENTEMINAGRQFTKPSLFATDLHVY